MCHADRVRPVQLAAGTLAVGSVAGAALTAYAAWEARAYTLRTLELPLLPPGHAPLRVLHLSDIHMTPTQRRKQEWVRSLADLEPDLVVNTGDNLSHRDAVPVVTEALGPLLDRPGVFVFGAQPEAPDHHGCAGTGLPRADSRGARPRCAGLADLVDELVKSKE